ncbi:MAG: ABC transporter permease [Paenibacillus sp.]|uniref:ABC transporter permease n=1 Tax=Paenibacillus sp. TaxID=58172 RepID=UPI0029103DA0|nr:ABC transporter permease [Paenibacillus sp.]MDU4697397.1 ABC transporter permease [Paenibacillus sp.]
MRKLTRILHAELAKLISLPSVWLTLIGTFILNLGMIAAYVSLGLKEPGGSINILNLGISSMGYLQVGFMILGILAASSEYNGGQIRTTLAAMPWRGLQFTTKHIALAIITIPAAFLMVASSLLYTWIRVREGAAGFEIDAMIEVLAGATGYLTLSTLLSAAIGALLRRTTPALVILLGYDFIISPLLRNSQFKSKNVLPDAAGSYMYRVPSPEELNALTPLQGTGVFLIWILVFVVVALVVYRKLDA